MHKQSSFSFTMSETDLNAFYKIFSNYCGPGGAGIPRHEVDRLCKEHDQDYDTIVQNGDNPYKSKNWADRKFERAVESLATKSIRESAIKLASKVYFTYKKVSYGETMDETKRKQEISRSIVKDMHAMKEMGMSLADIEKRYKMAAETVGLQWKDVYKELDKNMIEYTIDRHIAANPRTLDQQIEDDEIVETINRMQDREEKDEFGDMEDDNEAQDDFYRDQFVTPPRGAKRKGDATYQDIPSKKKHTYQDINNMDSVFISPDGTVISSQSNPPRNAIPPRDFENWNDRVHNQANEQRMDEPMEESATVAAAGETAGAGQNLTTAVVPLTARFPWHHVEQAVHQHHCSISVNHLGNEAEAQNYVKIRMNTPILPYTEMSVAAVTQNNYTQPRRGISNSAVGRYVVCNGIHADTVMHREVFSHNDPLFSDPAVTPYDDQIPSSLAWFQNHYSAYTVTKCEWTMYILMPYQQYQNTGTVSGDGSGTLFNTTSSTTQTHMSSTTFPGKTSGRIFTHYTSVGQSTPAVNPPLGASTLEMERWQNVYDQKVTLPMNGARVLRGTWTPGKVEHNALNDKDIDVWTSVGSVPTNSHLEHLVVQFKKQANDNLSPVTRISCNVHINLKYHVQYREPKTDIQYPLLGQANPSGTVINSHLLQSGPAFNV